LNEAEILQLSARCGYPSKQALILKNEASGREYWRLFLEKGSVVLCYLDPNTGNHSRFISTAKILHQFDINVPQVLDSFPEWGVTIQEDLGDSSLLDVWNEENAEELTFQSLDLLADIHSIPGMQIPTLQPQDLTAQMELFKNIFCNDFLDVEVHSSISALIDLASKELIAQPFVNCHFDFERRNLMLSKENKISVIDFQDLCKGPIGIDLAGILLDHYLAANHGSINKALTYFQKQSDLVESVDDAFEFVRWGGIQRNLRILGVLSRLYLEEGRDFRLKDMPMILKNLIFLIPDNSGCNEFMQDKVLPKLTHRLSSA